MARSPRRSDQNVVESPDLAISCVSLLPAVTGARHIRLRPILRVLEADICAVQRALSPYSCASPIAGHVVSPVHTCQFHHVTCIEGILSTHATSHPLQSHLTHDACMLDTWSPDPGWRCVDPCRLEDGLARSPGSAALTTLARLPGFCAEYRWISGSILMWWLSALSSWRPICPPFGSPRIGFPLVW